MDTYFGFLGYGKTFASQIDGAFVAISKLLHIEIGNKLSNFIRMTFTVGAIMVWGLQISLSIAIRTKQWLFIDIGTGKVLMVVVLNIIAVVIFTDVIYYGSV